MHKDNMHKGGFPHDPSIAQFTWDPEAAGLTGRAFTADTMSFTGYLTDVAQTDGTHVADRIEVFTGFSLHGKPVTPKGFGSDYGLYFHAVDKGIGGPPPNILDFKSVEVELKADPGNHNGPVISDASGTGFTNTGPTGEADDIVLAHGSLVSGMLFLDLTPTPPTLAGDQVGTFIPDVAEFFKGGSELLHNFAFNPATLLTMTDGPNGTSITNFNGYAGTAQFLSDHHGNGNAFGQANNPKWMGSICPV
jgi:hypothetical protein